MTILTPIDTTDFNPEFDHVYLVDGLGLVYDERTGLRAPDIENSRDFDILIDGQLVQGIEGEWRALTGHTNQHGYRGAVMHPSEIWGDWAIQDLASHAAEDGYVAFACVAVRPDLDEQDNDDYSDESPVGWAVAYKVVR